MKSNLEKIYNLKIILLSAISLTMLFSGCGINKGPDENNENSITSSCDLPEENCKLDSLYYNATLLTLPFNYTSGFMTHLSRLIRIPENMYDLFYNSENFDFDTRIAKLPDKENNKVILIYYNDDNEDAVIDLYALSENMEITDRISIYNTERPSGNVIEITKIYEISEDYIIKLSKHIEDILIEQLSFYINEDGHFTEIRNGSVPAVAYESFDNIVYTVESFIWDYDDNGTLYKKNLKKNTYEITGNGNIIEIQKS